MIIYNEGQGMMHSIRQHVVLLGFGIGCCLGLLSFALPAWAAGAATPAAPAAQCDLAGGAAGTDNAALQQQITELKQQLATQTGLPKAGAPPRDMAIRFKNLPAGTYRTRCFACLTLPDEDGERLLMCTCPVGNRLPRLSLALTGCAPTEPITFCGDKLQCAPCNLPAPMPALPAANESDTDKINRLLKPPAAQPAPRQSVPAQPPQ
jgi:hypothetical protein